MDNIKTKILIGGAIVLVLFAGINIVTLFVEPREGIEEGIIEETVSEDVIVVEEPETVSEDEIIIEGPPFESEEITLVATAPRSAALSVINSAAAQAESKPFSQIAAGCAVQ